MPHLENTILKSRARSFPIVIYSMFVPTICMLALFGTSGLTFTHSTNHDYRETTEERRSTTPSEIGLIFAYPNGFSWKDVGAYVGTPYSGDFVRMSADALKIQHGRFQFFSPDDETQFSFFPYSRLKQYDAQEGSRSSAFITATYKGVKRPVYFLWSLGLRDEMPTTPSTQWMQAVDISSDRFLKFWVNQYVKKILWRTRIPAPTWWVGIDNCAFMWELYGVIDDDGRFVAGVPWDPPYPQNSDQYLGSVERFFHSLSEIAPEIKTMCNVGGLKDPSQFEKIYADVPGIMMEDIFDPDPPEYARIQKNDALRQISWFGSVGRVAVLRAIVGPDSAQDLRTAYMIYLLVKGPNFFFAPEFKDSTLAVDPTQYSEMRSALGEPTNSMNIKCNPAEGRAYCLYSRSYEHGLVYVNWTGKAQEIKLPRDRRYFDFSGRPTTILAVPDLSGSYATTLTPNSSEAP